MPIRTRVATVFSILFLVIAFAPAASSSGYSKSVRIVRDNYGVPHISSRSLRSLWYGAGYAMAQDRLWQADLSRRNGTGTLAEVFGPGSVGGDVAARTLFGPAARRQAIFDSLKHETRIAYKAYVAGINAWIEEATATGQLPPEYSAFGLDPRPWTVDDAVASFISLLFFFGEFGADEGLNQAVYEEFVARFGAEDGARVFADTHWLDDPDAPSTTPGEGAKNPAKPPFGKARHFHGFGPAHAKLRKLVRGFAHNADKIGIHRGSRSNAVVIAPKNSADGRALMLAGPQAGNGTPQFTYEMRLSGAGISASGASIPGVPGIISGVRTGGWRGGNAWTLTSGYTDNADIYVEMLNPDNPKQYFYQGEYRDLDCREETIAVRGAPDVVTEACSSVHGPVLGTTSGGAALTRRSSSQGIEGRTFDMLIDLLRASSVHQFRRAVSKQAYSFNFLYADASGNIAHFHVGKVPIRAEGDNPWLPHDGRGDAEWQGFIPFEDMPQSLNPDQGWLVNWNNKPGPVWPNASNGSGMHGPVQRVNTLLRLVRQLPPRSATMETIAEINSTAGFTASSPSGQARPVVVTTLRDALVALIDEGADDRLPEIAALLSAWNMLQLDVDNNDFYDSPAGLVFNTWWAAAVERIFADDLGSALQQNVVANMMYRLITPDPALPLHYDNYLGGETVSGALTAALISALDDLEDQYGSADPGDWHQPVSEIFHRPIGLATVPNTIWMNRGTYNQLVHLGRGRKLFAENVVAPGQSGVQGSPHVDDQLELYATWTYKPMILSRRALSGNEESVTVLQPGIH